MHRLFRDTSPCPSAGLTHGHCPEAADHFIALCLGGPDSMANLWWEDRKRSHVKDDIERGACHAMQGRLPPLAGRLIGVGILRRQINLAPYSNSPFHTPSGRFTVAC